MDIGHYIIFFFCNFNLLALLLVIFFQLYMFDTRVHVHVHAAIFFIMVNLALNDRRL